MKLNPSMLFIGSGVMFLVGIFAMLVDIKEAYYPLISGASVLGWIAVSIDKEKK